MAKKKLSHVEEITKGLDLNKNQIKVYHYLSTNVLFPQRLIRHNFSKKAMGYFGWVVVLVGAVVMRFTNFTLIDPIMSTGVP